jgi:glycosyltransferase involved in cell wall biosynthesis
MPHVSVIVPTRNRPERLRRCLAALRQQTYPCSSYEIIVIDDGSDRPLDDVVRPGESPAPVTLMRQANAGPASARNSGADRASGVLLAFTDDDCEPDADWIAALWARHEQAPGAMIGGRTINVLVDDAYAEASQLLVDYLYEHYGVSRAQVASVGTRFFTSNNFAVPAALFRQVGGFDVTFPLAAGEDREFCDRWQHHGHPLLYAPEALVRHAHALTLAAFWRQHVNYGRGAQHFRLARARRRAHDVGVEPLSFYRNLVLYPFRVHPAFRAAHLSALLALAQLANATGYLRERQATEETQKKHGLP